MKEHEHNLDDFLKALKNDPVPAEPPQELVDAVLQKLKAAGEETAGGSIKEKITLFERINAMKTFTKLAVTVIIIAVLTGIVLFSNPAKKPLSEIVSKPTMPATKIAVEPAKETKEDLEANQQAAKAQAELDAQLQNVITLYNARDVNGLIAALSQEQLQVKLAAAYFLGEIGDLRAAEALEKLSSQFGGNDPNNLFAATVEKIMAKTAQAEAEQESQETTKPVVPPETGNVMDFFVINKQTQEPLEGVRLGINIDGNDSNDVTSQGGHCLIKLPEKLEYLRINISKNDFVPIQTVYNNDKTLTTIPKNYTLALEQGTSIGGFIHDEQDQPIESAMVYLFIPSNGDSQEQVAIHDNSVKTDANGFWRCDILPAKLDDVRIRLVHPDYISNEKYGMTPRPPLEQLRDMTGVMVMKKGVSVLGQAADINNKPGEVQAGQADNVNIGGTGRPVAGQITLPADYNQPIDWTCGDNQLISVKRDLTQQNTSDQPPLTSSYPFKAKHDGTFRVEDIPAGQYRLQIRIYERKADSPNDFGPLVGRINYEFEVSDIPGGRSNEPLDVGTLELKIEKPQEAEQ